MKRPVKPNDRPSDPAPVQPEVSPKTPLDLAPPLEDIVFPFASSDVLFAAWPAFRRDER